jgi:hypothetical protein
MDKQGPPLERLTRRLAECPPDFLAEPRLGGTGRVHADAVGADLLRLLGGPAPSAAEAAALMLGPDGPARRNRVRVKLLACRLLSDDWFASSGRFAPAARAFLASGLDATADLVDAALFASDAERREELARLALAALGLRPAGETRAQAEDLLAAVSSVERARVVAAAKAAQARLLEVRRAMKKKAAEEAAAKVSRE